MRPPSSFIGSLCVVALVLWCGSGKAATAETEASFASDALRTERGADGVYGRFDGDLDLGLGLGAELESDAIRGGVRLTAHYFAVAGVYGSYRHGFEEDRDNDARVLSFGIDLRPTFVPRWARNMQQGPAFLDLWIDSISLGLGAFWADPPHASFGDIRGFEASLGFGLPLFGTGAGLWLEARGVMRFPDLGERRDSVLLGLAWHTFSLTPFSE